MFLTETEITFYQSVGDIVNCVFSWLENHSGIIGIIVIIITGSLWSYKFLMQKRTEAFFGFYTRLYFQLKSLKSLLDDHDLLEIKSSDIGNIYSLLYIDSIRHEACEYFNKPSSKLFNDIKRLASQIKNTLTESESNVYPNASERKKWYDSQYVLFEFCEFLENDSKREITSKAKVAGENSKFKHTVKCRKLINAINYIKKSINDVITDNKH
jgi:hypothetical protein